MSRSRRPKPPDVRSPSRRRFLAQVALAAPGTLVGCWVGESRPTEAARAADELRRILEAVGEIVLPSVELDAAARARLVEAFIEWEAGFEPVAELDHPYLWSDELVYGPPDPRPGWAAQLRGLDAEARHRFDTSFASLDEAARRRMVERQLQPGDAGESLPHPTEAAHVAVALAAWYFSSPAANDLAYGARIGRHACGGLATVGEEPAPFDDGGSEV